jgi:(1->4)-alpha-D-glucan 1-alpha-D-glucosylmutase
MYVTLRALTLRRQLPTLFRSGPYEALSAEGEHAAHIVALTRWDDTNFVVVVVPRLSARLTAFGGRYPLGDSVWGDTRIVLDRPGFEGIYTDRFSGLHIVTAQRNGTPTLPVAALLGRLPVAMLRRETTP